MGLLSGLVRWQTALSVIGCGLYLVRPDALLIPQAPRLMQMAEKMLARTPVGKPVWLVSAIWLVTELAPAGMPGLHSSLGF